MVTGYAGSAALSHVMSRPVICPLNVGAVAPESLSILQRRLEAAEEQSEELVRSLGALGVSADKLLMKSSVGSSCKQPVSPVNICRTLGASRQGLLRKQCETLVSSVCRLESLLQTLKLTTYRLETDRELHSSHTACLQEQLNTLQGRYEEEQRSSQKEVLHLQDRLQQACEEREEAQQEVFRLKEESTKMLEQTIKRLQGDLSCALRAEETMRKERAQIKSTLSSEISLLEKKKNLLETQLSEIKVKLTSVNSGLQKQEKENRALMESLALMENQQETHCQVEQILWDLTDRKSKLAYEKSKLQARVQQMEDDLKTLKAECTQHCQMNMTLQTSYTQAQRENQMLKEHLSTLQQQSRDTSEVVQVLEDVLTSHTLLQQNTHTLQAELRDGALELHTLRTEKLQYKKEIQKLKADVEHLHMLTHTKSNKVESLQKALSEAQLDNRKLGQTLEQEKQKKLNTLSQREAELKEARTEIRKLIEHVNSLKNLLKGEKDSGRKSTRQVTLKRHSDWSELSGHLPQLHSHSLKKTLDDELAKSCDLSQANQKLREKVSELEKVVFCQKFHLDTRTAQNSSLRLKITEIMDEDHRDLCSISESFSGESEPQKLRENLQRTGRDLTPSTAAQDRRNLNNWSPGPPPYSAGSSQKTRPTSPAVTNPADVCTH